MGGLFMKKLFKMYFSSKGRMKRLPYLITSLSITFVFIVLLFLGGFAFVSQAASPGKGMIVMAVAFLVCMISWVILTIKRLHDLNHSGWWVILSFLPYLNIPVILYLLIRKSVNKNNRFNTA